MNYHIWGSNFAFTSLWIYVKQIDKIQGLKSEILKSTNSMLKLPQSEANVSKVDLLKGITIFKAHMVFGAVIFAFTSLWNYLKQIDKIQGLKSKILKSPNSIPKLCQTDTNVLKINLLKEMTIFSAHCVFGAVILHLQVCGLI